MIAWAERHFWLFFALGIGLALAMPREMSALSGLALPALAVVLLLTYLRLDVSRLRVFRSPYLVAFGALRFLALPVAAALLLGGWRYSSGAVLLLAMPAGLSTPVLAHLFGAAMEEALVLSISGHLLSPFSVPAVLGLSGASVSVPLSVISRMLALLVLLPFALAALCRTFLPRLVRRTSPSYSALSLALLTVIIAGTIAPHSASLLGAVREAPALLALLVALCVALHLFGWLLAIGRSGKERVTLVISSSFMNSTLALVLASRFLSADALLVSVLYLIPLNLASIPLGLLARRMLASESR